MYMNAFIAAAIIGLTSASPVEIRQTRINSSEFSDGGCRDVLFAFARGSTEVGNMGTVVGPPTSDGLKQALGANAVATEGINYAALISTNVLPGGTDAVSKNLMKKTLQDMASQCPDSIIIASGYSQGAAVCHRAIEELDASVQNKIAGVVLYGDTQKQQDNDQIPNFPKDKVDIICQPGDLVCVGTLTVLPPHLTYGLRADEGVDFLVGKVKGAQAKLKAKRAAEEAKRGVVEGLKEAVHVMA